MIPSYSQPQLGDEETSRNGQELPLRFKLLEAKWVEVLREKEQRIPTLRLAQGG